MNFRWRMNMHSFHHTKWMAKRKLKLRTGVCNYDAKIGSCTIDLINLFNFVKHRTYGMWLHWKELQYSTLVLPSSRHPISVPLLLCFINESSKANFCFSCDNTYLFIFPCWFQSPLRPMLSYNFPHFRRHLVPCLWSTNWFVLFYNKEKAGPSVFNLIY